MNKLKFLSIICLLFTSITTNAQGINFQNFDSWSEILETAQRENKPIFIDIYTTWCGPCKAMDQEVYIDSLVGDFFNKNFISVKVQMDMTKNDSEQIKKWYSEAQKLAQNYDVNGYPTFLFISPKGLLLNKSSGFKNAKDFIKIASIALNSNVKYIAPSVKYQEAILNYKNGKINGDSLYFLLDDLVKMRVDYFAEQNKIIDTLTNIYLGYLRNSSEEKKYSKNALEVIGRTGLNSSDPLFSIFYNNEKIVDQIVGKVNFCRQLIDRTISKEYVKDVLTFYINKSNTEPKWDSLYNVIKLRYNDEYARRAIDAAKLPYYYYTLVLKKKDSTNKYNKAVIELLNNYGPYSITIHQVVLSRSYSFRSIELELFANWEIGVFCYLHLIPSKNPDFIKSGVILMKGVMDYLLSRELTPINKTWIFDQAATYCILLQKNGNIKEATEFMRTAIKEGLESNLVDQRQINKYKGILKNIEEGIRNWPSSRDLQR